MGKQEEELYSTVIMFNRVKREHNTPHVKDEA
jgi:hypothetical protein